MSADLIIIRDRSANGTFRYLEKTSTARRSFSSICESDNGSNDFRSSPVAGLMVAIAIDVPSGVGYEVFAGAVGGVGQLNRGKRLTPGSSGLTPMPKPCDLL